jgi:hypothetical protein
VLTDDTPVRTEGHAAALARHLGVSREAVSRAIRRGRFERSITIRDCRAYFTDFAMARREWNENVDRTKAPAFVKDREVAAALANARIGVPDDFHDGPVEPRRIAVDVVDDGLLCVQWLDYPDANAGIALDRAGALELAQRLTELANTPAMLLPVTP